MKRGRSMHLAQLFFMNIFPVLLLRKQQKGQINSVLTLLPGGEPYRYTIIVQLAQGLSIHAGRYHKIVQIHLLSIFRHSTNHCQHYNCATNRSVTKKTKPTSSGSLPQSQIVNMGNYGQNPLTSQNSTCKRQVHPLFWLFSKNNLT